MDELKRIIRKAFVVRACSESHCKAHCFMKWCCQTCLIGKSMLDKLSFDEDISPKDR